MTHEELCAKLDSMKSGMFGERETIQQAVTYAKDLLTASSPNELNLSIMIALGVYGNSVLEMLKEELKD